jgi:translation elongation factor EF-Ts
MEIKANDVKTLREKTGAGMMECKKALVEAKGDFSKAEKLLKELGLAAVEKRAGRATNEGKIFVRVLNGKAAMAELSCETDFVARNTDFISCGAKIIDTVLAKGKSAKSEELAGFVRDAASVIKENMSLKRYLYVESGSGEYLHEYIKQNPPQLSRKNRLRPLSTTSHSILLHSIQASSTVRKSLPTISKSRKESSRNSLKATRGSRASRRMSSKEP